MVKNIAYATEEETLMGNGVNLRTLTNDGGSAVISDYGAHLLRWAPAGQPDVIWTPRTWHFEAGQPVGGGVPVCFPWFGPGFVHGGQTAKRPIHGFARLRQWALDEEAFTGARVRYVLDSERLTTGEVPWIEDEPNVRFHAAYEVCASDTLTMTLTVTNTGGEPMSYEAALQRAAQAELAVCFYENEEQRTFRAAIESAPFRTAALLTLVCYSLNDTIIVYDRIRENLQNQPEDNPAPLADIINLSVNQTLGRTIMTSATTLIAALSLTILGGGAIHDFALTMSLGVFIGTFSSVFVSNPILLLLGDTRQYMVARKKVEYERPGEHGVV